jgi:hypothetical protein
MPTSRQIVQAIITFFEGKPAAAHTPMPTGGQQPSGPELLAMLEIIADRWHCTRAGHDDLRTWIWNLQVTLSEVDLAAEEDLQAVLKIEKHLHQLQME